MPCMVQFGEHTIDIDVLDWDMADWEQVEQRSGIAGLPAMLNALGNWSPTAWKSVYWVGAQRAGLAPGDFSDFRGPTFVDIFQHRSGISAMVDRLNEVLDPKDDHPQGIDGSDPSAPSSDGAPPTDSTP